MSHRPPESATGGMDVSHNLSEGEGVLKSLSWACGSAPRKICLVGKAPVAKSLGTDLFFLDGSLSLQMLFSFNIAGGTIRRTIFSSRVQCRVPEVH